MDGSIKSLYNDIIEGKNSEIGEGWPLDCVIDMYSYLPMICAVEISTVEFNKKHQSPIEKVKSYIVNQARGASRLKISWLTWGLRYWFKLQLILQQLRSLATCTTIDIDKQVGQVSGPVKSELQGLFPTINWKITQVTHGCDLCVPVLTHTVTSICHVLYHFCCFQIWISTAIRSCWVDLGIVSTCQVRLSDTFARCTRCTVRVVISLNTCSATVNVFPAIVKRAPFWVQFWKNKPCYKFGGPYGRNTK